MPAFLNGLVITLREGIEAALLVALLLAALDRAGQGALRGAVYGGVVAAMGASAAGAALLVRLGVSAERLEGFLYLAAAVMVASMLVWMRGSARGLRGRIDSRVARLAD